VSASTAPARVTRNERRSREAFLLDAGRALAEARSTEDVLRVAAGLSMPGLSPDGVAIFTAEGDEIRIVGHHGHKPDDVAPFVGMPLDADYPAAEVIRTGHAVYLSSPEEYQKRYPDAWPLIEQLGRQSWAFLPLVAGGRMVGVWVAAFAYPVRFLADDRSVLTTVARMLAQALSRAGLAETERELSKGVQESMLPNIGTRVQGLSMTGRYVPTGGGVQVGGDWYDAIPLPSGRIAFVIGDVQGHDVRAAGLMGQLRIALRAYAAEGHRPDAVLSRASRFLSDITAVTDHQGSPDGSGDVAHAAPEHADERFATCLYVEVDPATGALEVARAGHLDPVVRTPDGTILVRPTSGGLPLGIDPDSDYPRTQLVLEPGETMLICTDGLVETGGYDLATGWARVESVLDEHGDKGLEVLADALLADVHGKASRHATGPLADRRDDDIAVLLLRRSSDPTRRVITRRAALGVAQSEPERIADARRQLRELLHDWPDDQVDSAELLVSELLANVLIHTDGDAWLVAEVTGKPGGRRMRVEVADSSDDLPHKRRPGELASSGRGLVLIAFLADRWGVAPRGDGKSIWFELWEPGANGSQPLLTGTGAGSSSGTSSDTDTHMAD
jgi:serine phosphatase RsbU (regulator of sigma subunit)/anti-sigma regulatory factor (Ser/Thr protein kinase)